MPVPFLRADLLTDISDAELTALVTRVTDAGGDDPVNSTIARAQELVDRYTKRYVLDAAVAQGLVRDLTLYHLYSRFPDPPLNRVAAYWETWRTLKDIRDGRYPDLPLSEVEGDDEERVAWSSQRRICLKRRESRCGSVLPECGCAD